MLNTNNINVNLHDLEGGISYINMESSTNDSKIFFCVKISVLFIIIIFALPLAICDLYFAYNDSTCVNEPAGRLAINLHDYLLVYGWLSICLIIIIMLFVIFFVDLRQENNQSLCFICGGGIIMIVTTTTRIFALIWNIFGAIIFWGLMDTSNCSNTIYNYVFASLIIKFVSAIIALLNDEKNEKK